MARSAEDDRLLRRVTQTARADSQAGWRLDRNYLVVSV
jgi:hypothetical protein